MRAPLLLLPLALLSAGCDADCGNPGRINGTYLLNANVLGDGATVEGLGDVEDHDEDRTTLLHGLMVNGQRTWGIRSQPSAGGYQITVDGQQFNAQATPSDDNCNLINLQMTGAWSNPENGATHQFAWNADLVWTGDELGGSFTYDDEWGLNGETGSITIPKGELRTVSLGGGGADTGE